MTACRTMYPSLALTVILQREGLCDVHEKTALHVVCDVPLQGVVRQCRFVKRQDEDLRTPRQKT